MLVRGSHDSTIHIRSVGGDRQGNATHLYIDGNPSKWLQGHNLVGSCDLVALVWDAFQRLCAWWALSRLTLSVRRSGQGSTASLASITTECSNFQAGPMFEPGCRAGEFKCKSRHGRPVNNRGTLTFGKGSSHWSIVYCARPMK
ncbi:phage/plasmid replication protein, II/X family [Pseudomonas aeruginosa]|uniref:phage/plasmid replication protein, II/X family n=1 Tax=Pseudomonas aeruginosa TaxID=287 RepID=UPI00391F68FB